jgi:hypothetical protein
LAQQIPHTRGAQIARFSRSDATACKNQRLWALALVTSEDVGSDYLDYRQWARKLRRGGAMPGKIISKTERAITQARFRVVTACLVVGLATFSVAILPAQVAQAATDTVTNCSGSVSVAGSLPYEVANASPGDTIAFAFSGPCRTITLTSTIDISKNLTITGPGANVLSVSGGGSTEIFDVAGGTVFISGLTIEAGNATNGGGIYNSATLTVTDSTLSGDSASRGGGIDNVGTLTVSDSTLSNDIAGQSGGGIESDNASLTVSNSTLANDSASEPFNTDGGGIDMYDGGGSVTNSTLSHDSADYGGGIEDDQGNLTMSGTIVANSPSGSDCFLQLPIGTFTDNGDNLDDDGTCHLTAGTDLSHTAAGLDPSGLQNNGGPTQTIALESGSAAIDHVSNGSLCPATDQRGAPRTTPCDIGAYDTDWGPAIALNVTGSQVTGGNPSFSYTTNAPGGIVSGALTCTTVDDGTPISTGLAAGYYTIDGSSCSGLASSDQATYPIFPSSYTGTFVVSASPAWTISTSPDPGADDNAVTGVSCTSVIFCVAVGYQTAVGSEQTLIESWDGSTWSVVSSPDGGGFNALDGVSCTSPTSCVAVGFDQSGTTDQTLVESWDGSNWSLASSPDMGGNENFLNAVSCSTATGCVAVGSYYTGSVFDTLIETLSGGSWVVTSSPNPGASFNELNGVSCTSTTSCVAAGENDAGSTNDTLIETLSGGSWIATSSPSPGSTTNQLNAVSCSSATSCVAVGEQTSGSALQTLVEALGGGTWSVTSSPNDGSGDNVLNGVSCVTASACEAVGYDGSGAAKQTLIESGNSGTWSIAPSSSPGSDNNNLYGVSCTSPTSCAAVGDYSDGALGNNETLVEMASTAVVAALSPATDVTTGGTTVTITGSGFTGATAVDFGATPATIDSESGGTSLTVIDPPGTAGTVDVTVTAPGGISALNSADQFTYTVEQSSVTEQCQPTCTNAASTTLNTTSVSVVGNSGTSSSGPSTTLVVNTGSLSCGTSKAHDYDYPTAVSTLSATDFPAHAALSVTETVGNEPSTKGVGVCYAVGSDPTGTFLHHCKVSMKAPCLETLTESSGSVIATFLSPANDPRFWTGEAAAALTTFSPAKGAPGATFTIKGKNLTGALGVVIGGVNAAVSQKSTSTKLLVTVPPKAALGPGLVTVTSASGQAVSTKTFTVT